MASKKRQREIERAKSERKFAAARVRRRLSGSVLLVIVILLTVFALRPNRSASDNSAKNTPRAELWTLNALLKLPPHQIEELDVAVLNFLCAEGLAGSETVELKKSPFEPRRNGSPRAAGNRPSSISLPPKPR